ASPCMAQACRPSRDRSGIGQAHAGQGRQVRPYLRDHRPQGTGRGVLMAFADTYRKQVALLIRTLPSVAAEECFAMKGGTAINLFVRDLPRLSVDIDLTYLPVQDRATSLAAIDGAMECIAERVTKAVGGARVAPSRSRENVITKL